VLFKLIWFSSAEETERARESGVKECRWAKEFGWSIDFSTCHGLSNSYLYCYELGMDHEKKLIFLRK
jgi:hypothetical protein